MLKRRRLQALGFESRLWDRWDELFDLLETFYYMSIESGYEYVKNNFKTAKKNKDFLFSALVKIQARACLIYMEVLTLLENGLPDGAYARVRSLYELVVTSLFLTKYGNSMAERYLDYAIIETYKEAVLYQKYYKKLGYKPPLKGNLRELSNMRRSLCSQSRYKDEFYEERNDCTWIPSDLIISRSVYGMAKAVKMNMWRPHYKVISANIHGTAKGITFSLGLYKTAKILLAGKSNYGLADPAQLATIFMHQINTCLLTKTQSIENLSVLLTMQKFVEDISYAAYKIQKQIEKEERERKHKK